MTNLPCVNCALLVINAGIVRVVWDQDYRIRDSLTLFQEASIRVDRYDRIAT